MVAVATLPAMASLQLAVAYRAVTRRYGKPRITISPAVLLKTARGAVPHAASQFLSQIYSRIDVVFLGFMIGEAAAGLYNVGYRVVFVLLFIPHFAAVALFPQASSLYLPSKGELRRLFNEALRLAWLIGLPMSADLWLIAPDLISLIYGEQFSEAGTVPGFLAWLLLLAFLSRITLTVLIACNEEVAVAQRQWVAALVNVAGNLALIPVLGVLGATRPWPRRSSSLPGSPAEPHPWLATHRSTRGNRSDRCGLLLRPLYARSGSAAFPPHSGERHSVRSDDQCVRGCTAQRAARCLGSHSVLCKAASQLRLAPRAVGRRGRSQGDSAQMTL